MENNNENDVLKKAIQFGIGYAAGIALSKAISIKKEEYRKTLEASDEIIDSIIKKYQK